jgi:alkyl sulfatase BDS1-like metallo-beta-lactamase superfamily hydrolase
MFKNIALLTCFCSSLLANTTANATNHLNEKQPNENQTKPASKYTAAHQQALLESLPFADDFDFS